MLVIVMFVALALPGRTASFVEASRSCRSEVLAKVIRDEDQRAPFIIITHSGRAFRVLGQDFINPAQWHRGQALQACEIRDAPQNYDLANTARHEYLPAVSIPVPLSQPAAAEEVRAVSLQRLRRPAPQLDVRYDTQRGSEMLFSVHDRSGCVGDQATCSTLVGHFAVDRLTGAVGDTDKRDAEAHSR